MKRQQAKELLPIIQAFAEGKTIQYYYGDNWVNIRPDTAVDFSDNPSNYRIKPEPKYRPFRTKEECWNEMLKHKPLGWIKASHGQFLIIGLRNEGVFFGAKDNLQSYNYMFEDYTFIDETPFGIKE